MIDQKKLTVISLGAGVQSSTMALMAAHGEITPMPDCAIFADTQAEPQHVYDWLDWLESQLPFPVYRVTAGSLRDVTLQSAKDKTTRNATPPFYTNAGGGLTGAPLRRQCTSEYKIVPIRKKLRSLVGLQPRQRAPKNTVLAEQWIGISLDEIQRMKENGEPYFKHRWPLIEKRMTRLHCLEWMRDNGYNELPQKSACTFCPYHDDDTWRKMRSDDPESWEDACLMDEQIRGGVRGTKHELYLHRSLIPLREVNFDDYPGKDQMGFDFMDECDGMCGV